MQKPDFDPSIAQQAGTRWKERESARTRNVSALQRGRVEEVESPQRIQMRLAHLTEVAERAAVRAAAAPTVGGSRLVETISLERVIGKRDFLGIEFLEMALAVSRFVARIRIRDPFGSLAGYGTGFMVSPSLLLTNNHVLGSREEARASEGEFDYQNDRYGRPLPVETYPLDPERFFLTDKRLDFTLVAVKNESLNGTKLERYGWSRLIGAQGKALLGDALNIVQHPSGRVKEIVLRSNELIDLLEDFAHYITDTEPGSSGSPVYSDQWKVVALHHSGVPKTDNQGRILTKDNRIWREGMDPGLIEWVANEGVRVSRIVEFIKDARLRNAEEERLREELLEREPPHPLEVASTGTSTPRLTSLAAAGAAPSSTWTIPLRVTLSLESPTLEFTSAKTVLQPLPLDDRDRVVAPPAPPAAVAVEAISIDPDYGNRKGYDSRFLGDATPVPLPELSEELLEEAAINQEPRAGEEPYVLPYHHFSVVINGERRLALLTAVNIDGRRARKVERENDRWFFDPRIARDEQAGNEVYAANPLDRGHLVRRLDPAWGTTRVAKTANDDTFHFTNCSPQHAGFNQNRTTWAGVEDYILQNAVAHDLKVCVFTGPVLRGDDPEYRHIRLPRQFWKVAAILKEDGGQLSATAYLLSQAELLEDLEEEAFAYGAYRTFQVPISKIEELTGLSFGNLKEADPLGAAADLEELAVPYREVRALTQIRL